jgi:hypothetical protein
MRFIGDVHGKFDSYLALIDGVNSSIQCGDMGIGFGIPFPVIDESQMFIHGNHDDYLKCLSIPNFIDDGSFDEDNSIFCIGGAWSIDWEWRQNHMNHGGNAVWWKEEEQPYPKLEKIINWYEECKPEIMVSHDCPLIMAQELKSNHQWDNSRTRNALNSMFEIHKPELWIFGHHHVNMTRDIKGTRFICLDELDFIDIQV